MKNRKIELETLEGEDFKKAVAHVVKKMLCEDGEAWNGTYPMMSGFLGWKGVMSPENRPAFVGAFGEVKTAEVEAAANAEIAARRGFWAKSKAKAHCEEAERNGKVDPAALKVGDFVFGREMTLKCEGPFMDTLRDTVNSPDCLKEKTLCRIDRIIEVDEVASDGILHKSDGNEGGSCSEDLTDEMTEAFQFRFRDMPKEWRDTFFMKTVLVRDKSGKWYLIDYEGYNYARYIIVPTDYAEMFKDDIEAIRDEKEARERKEAEEVAAEKERRKAAYLELCSKWEGLMKPVRDGDKRSEVGKKNILAMVKHAFPWVRFWVSYKNVWGTGYVLKWTNGPTEKELREACALGLFRPSWDTFDGMTDCADTDEAEFHDFSDKFGGMHNGVRCERSEADTDMNSSPDKVETTAKATGGVAEVRENKRQNGVEIVFPSVPSAAVRDFMKSVGFRWSRRSMAWYNYASDESRANAEKAADMFNKGEAVA